MTFTPTDTTDYTTATATVTLTVNKATPTITWATPAAITYGTALSATQLDASSTVAGTFVYTPAAGAVLTAGSQTLSVTFTPTDTTDYTTATATVTLTVNKARRRSPGRRRGDHLRHGAERDAARCQLDGGGNVCLYTGSGNGADGGITDPVGDVYADRHDATTRRQRHRQLTVNKATPAITWATPAAITYGTALSATQLDASSTVAGPSSILRQREQC